MSPFLRVLRPLDDGDVAVEDSRVDHRVALDAKQELLSSAREWLRNGEIALDVVLREQRPACGDLADQRKLVDVRGDGLRLATQLQRARLRRDRA